MPMSVKTGFGGDILLWREVEFWSFPVTVARLRECYIVLNRIKVCQWIYIASSD